MRDRGIRVLYVGKAGDKLEMISKSGLKLDDFECLHDPASH